MNRKLIATAGAAIIASVGVAAPAMAYEIKDGDVTYAIPDYAPTAPEKPEFDISKLDKPTPQEQADLTSKRLDNAKKGMETTEKIVDTLGKLGGLFGFKPSA